MDFESNPAETALSGAPHKAHVKVDEQGTEAAAATIIVGGPFVFSIVDNQAKAVLFLGSEVGPR